MKYSITAAARQLTPAILSALVLVGCGGGSSTPPPAPAPTSGTVTVNVTGSGTVTGVLIATFSSGQIVPNDASTVFGALTGSSGTLIASSLATPPTTPTALKVNVGNYGLTPMTSSSTVACQVASLVNATADTAQSYSGNSTNNFNNIFMGGYGMPIIPIALTGGDAIINITCNNAVA